MKDADRQLMMGWLLMIAYDVAHDEWWKIVCAIGSLGYFLCAIVNRCRE